METSAKENCQVEGAFRLMTSEVIRHLGGYVKPPEADTVAEWMEEEGIQVKEVKLGSAEF